MDFEKTRLDKVIRRKFGKNIPQSLIERAIRNKDILLNLKKTSASAKVSEKDDIYIHQSFENLWNKKEDKPVTTDPGVFEKLIIYEDRDIIAINKPSGLAVQLGTDMTISVDNMARAYNSEARLVHRIDKDTSGITLLSKNLKTSRFMLHLFKTHQISKRYQAIVSSKNLHSKKGIINIPISKSKDQVIIDRKEGKEAITEFKCLKNLPEDLALLELTPKTGRTHQIRVHLQFIGCPILGDRKYGGRNYKKLCLHASSISFLDLEGKKITIKAPLPDHMECLL